MGNVELLAPAGNMECFRAAINAGADAVYIGGQKFGARAYAGNFDDEEVLQAIRIAHFWNRKVYLTVNTLLKKEELAEVVPYLEPFYRAGLDGIIVQDLGVLKVCRERLPGLALHASTQLTVTESGAANLLKKLGVERIVPARELSLKEIRQLKEESGLEIETFIHGALCYAYSGQCLFSSFLGGRSGNRGRCAQPCRQPYRMVSDNGSQKEEQYPLSLKDLCVLQILPSLIDAGIDSFKIEGRMKSPEYVAGVTAVYRKYIDLYQKNPAAWSVDHRDLKLLSGLYVRSGLEQGYYERHNGKEMVTLDKPGYMGGSEEVLESIRRDWIDKQMQRPVSFQMQLCAGKPAGLTASVVLEDGAKISSSCEEMEVSPAQKRPVTAADVEKQLKKTGGSNYYAETIDTDIEGDIFIPVGAINELRRNTLDLLTEKICSHHTACGKDRAVSRKVSELSENHKSTDSKNEKMSVHVQTLFADQAVCAIRESGVARVYISADALLSKKENTEAVWEAVQRRKDNDSSFSFYLSLPPIIRSYTENWLGWLDELIRSHDSLIDGILAASLSGIAAVRRFGWKKKIALASGAYTWNEESLAEYDSMGNIVTYGAPLELNRISLSALPAQRMEVPVYGRVPMMISAGCIKKTSGECQIRHTQKSLSAGLDRRSIENALIDRYQVQFPVLTNCMHCMNTIYNSVPLSLHGYMDEIKKMGIQAIRLDFTDENIEQTRSVLEFYLYGQGEPAWSYTTGHYKKGAQ